MMASPGITLWGLRRRRGVAVLYGGALLCFSRIRVPYPNVTACVVNSSAVFLFVLFYKIVLAAEQTSLYYI